MVVCHNGDDVAFTAALCASSLRAIPLQVRIGMRFHVTLSSSAPTPTAAVPAAIATVLTFVVLTASMI